MNVRVIRLDDDVCSVMSRYVLIFDSVRLSRYSAQQ